MQPPGAPASATTPYPGASLLKTRVVRDPIYDLFQRHYPQAMQRGQPSRPLGQQSTPQARPAQAVSREMPGPRPLVLSRAPQMLDRGAYQDFTMEPPAPAPQPLQSHSQGRPVSKTEKDTSYKRPSKESPVPLPVIIGMRPQATKPTSGTHSHHHRHSQGASPRNPTASSTTELTVEPKPEAETEAAPRQPTPAYRGRGRPRGWRPGMSYTSRTHAHAHTSGGRGAARQSRPNPGFGVVKRRGRPPKQPSPPPRALYRSLDVPFVAFLCEWRGCKAELHNLETLRKHVEVVHVRAQQGGAGGFRGSCHWGRCGDVAVKREAIGEEEGAGDGTDKGGTRETFDDVMDLRMHIGEKHLVPFGWHVGDGPRNRISVAVATSTSTEDAEDEIPGYLKDAHGNQVTPSIKDQKVEDYLTWRATRQKLRELLLKRDKNLPSDESDMSGEEEPQG